MRTPQRRVRNQLEAGERVFGATVHLPCPAVAELAGYAGLDFVWIDAEHSVMDLSDINHLVRAADAAGIDAIVRVPDQSTTFIQRVLETGAAGLLVPHVKDVTEAKSIVAAAKFSPAGFRGACPSTRALGYGATDWSTGHRQANADVLVFGLIEEVEGVENVEQIACDSGLDGLMFGTFDLAQTLGLPGDVRHPDIMAMRERVIAATRKANIEYFSIPGWEETIAEAAQYSRVMCITGDTGTLLRAFRTARSDAISAIG
jgi:2-keto-3-deoxy-L-rhamnonate aldolase RhmA